MANWQKYALIGVAVAAIYLGGLSGLIVGATILLHVTIVATFLPLLKMGQERLQAIEKRLGPADQLDDEEEFSFDLPDPSPDGWESYMVYPSRHLYRSEYCFGGPPVHNKTWEYEIKGSQVFHRLKDASEKVFEDPVFQVINGTVCEDDLAKSTPADASQRFERYRHDMQWHECKESVSLEILAIHFRQQRRRAAGIFTGKQKKLIAAFANMEKELVVLGAIETTRKSGPIS